MEDLEQGTALELRRHVMSQSFLRPALRQAGGNPASPMPCLSRPLSVPTLQDKAFSAMSHKLLSA